MKCIICKQGETKPGNATVLLERDESIVIFKRVPADICENCGEYYLSDDISEAVLTRAESALSTGTEVEIRKYVA
ncbi:MAG: type II toxin-antitoxin system MqsA family antitoxin [Phormidesmis sp.]